MATAPIIDGITFDQPSYAPGATVTATVTLQEQTVPVTATYTPSSTAIAAINAAFNVVLTVGTVTDTGKRTWVLVPNSYNGITAKFTTTA